MRWSRIAAIAVLLAFLTSGPTRAVDEERARPNIVLIIADDLGYGDLGCYGQTTIQTPHIDKLAAEGVRFTRGYAGSTVCAPSRCALMTGLHTGHARVRGNARVPLRPEDQTIPEVLKAAGYTTGLFGKWGLGEPDTTGIPNRKGFDQFFGYLNQAHAHNYYPDHLWRNKERAPLPGNRLGPVENVSVQREEYAPDRILQEALAFLDANRSRAFFLEFATILPHANNERGRAEGNGMEVPDLGRYAKEDWPAPQKGHAAMISRLDAHVGQILERLRTLGLEKKTLVLFTSDNGPHKEGGGDPTFFKSSAHLRGFKRALYEGGIRVPLIARWPGRIAPGTTNGRSFAFWDMLPTLAEIGGGRIPKELDGVSLAAELGGQGPHVEHPPLYWEFHEGGFKQAALIGDWKAVRTGLQGRIELFDLARDESESRDVAGDHPDIVDRLKAFLDGARTDSPDFPITPAPRKAKAARG